MKRTAIMAVISLLFISTIASVGVSSAYTYVPPFSQTVSMPSYAFGGQNFTIYVNESFGFSNYTLTVYIGGDNLTGLSPQSSQHFFQASNPDFKLNVTSPVSPQSLYVRVVAAAQFASANVTSKTSYTVSVVSPIVFHAVVVNKGVSTVHNLTIDFYLDNSQFPAGNVTVATLLPNQQVVVNFTYPRESLPQGEHTLTVSSSSSFVQVNGQSGTYTSNFYYGTPPNYNWIFYVAIVVVIVMGFLALSAGRRPSGGAARPPKWRRNK